MSPVPFWRRQAWASALAAVLVLGIATLGGASYMNQVVASYALVGDAPGRAQVVVKRNGSIELQMEGIEAPPPGKVYEAWIIPPGQQPVPAGVVRNGGQATVPLTGQALGSTVAVTVEQGPDGTGAPTSQPVMAGTIRS